MAEAIKVAKQAMENCQKAVDLVTAQLATNQALVDHYNNVQLPEYRAKRETWQKNKSDRENAQQQWDQRKNEWVRHLSNEDLPQGCSVLGPANSGRCDGDFYEHRRECCNHKIGSCWGDRRICRRHGHKAENDAINNTKGERGDRPTNWTESAPEEPKVPQQNTTPINVTCCANIQHIVASQLLDSRLSQENNCKQQLQKDLEAAQAAQAAQATQEAEAARKAQEATKKAESQTPPTSQTAPASTDVSSDTIPTSLNNPKFIGVLVILFLILLCLFLSSSISFVVST